MLVLLKNHLNYHKDNFFAFLRSIYFPKGLIKVYFFLNIIFFITYNDKNPRPEEENINKGKGNPFRPKKELNYTAVNSIRNLFRVEKETKAITDRILL